MGKDPNASWNPSLGVVKVAGSKLGISSRIVGRNKDLLPKSREEEF